MARILIGYTVLARLERGERHESRSGRSTLPRTFTHIRGPKGGS